MFYKYQDAKPVKVLPGLVRRTLISSGTLMVCEFTLDEGVKIPAHSHPQEQAGYVASGEILIKVGNESLTLLKGDSYYAPSGVMHSALVIKKAVVIDTFHPQREDYK